MLELLFTIWAGVAFTGLILAIAFCAACEWQYDSPLKDAQSFLLSVFYWQGTIWANTEEKINLAGEIVLQILAAPFATPVSLLMLVLLLVGEVCRFLAWAFMAVFGKKEVSK